MTGLGNHSGTVREQYRLKIDRPTKDGQRQVQVVRVAQDPIREVPVGDPVILEDGESLSLDLVVDILSELERDESVSIADDGDRFAVDRGGREL